MRSDMKFEQFVGQTVNRLELPNRARAVRAIRATLTTLGERLQEGEATDLAASLPMEIDYYLLSADHGQRFSFDAFIDRVMDRENMAADKRGDAVYHVKIVMQLVSESVPQGEIEDVRNNLPDEYNPLFELVDS